MKSRNNGYEFKKRLGRDASGHTLLEYLEQRYSGSSRIEWFDRIASGRVRLDGVSAQAQAILSPGQLLSWFRPPWEEPEVPLCYAILYEDAHLVGVAKPEGLPTLPGGGRFLEHTLFALVRKRFPEANPLHRLGRGTSGVVLFARTPEAFAAVSRDWGEGRTLKLYRTLISGQPDWKELSVDAPIGPVPHPVLRSVHAAVASGKPAHSRATVLEWRDAAALVDVRITTGRPHQIRIHMAAAGHPLVGDPLYMAGGIPPPVSRALPGDLGYHLHCMTLGFAHPADCRWVEITCLPPPILRRRSASGAGGQD